MGLLAPLFLIGALAVALPIWLHRLQTQSSDRQPFSSAMLLETTEQRVHLQKKLKYLVLLALRIAVLLLIAAAFAKPFLARPPALLTAGRDGTHLILVDSSVSMSRAGVFDQAVVVARQLVDDAPSGALKQVLRFDDTLHLAGDLSANPMDQRTAIAGLAPTSLRGDFGAAMAAVDRLAESLPPPVTLHLISDFQESAMPVRFADVVASSLSRLVPHVVGTGGPVNWFVEAVREVPDGVQVAVFGSGERERVADVALSLNGEVVAAQSLSEVGLQTLTFAGLQFAEGENRLEVRIDADDDLAADNRWYHVVANEAPHPVPLLTLNNGGLPVTYLSAALEADAGSNYRVEPVVIADFDPRVLERHRFVMIDDIGAVDEALAGALADYLANGGNVLAFAGERAAGVDTLPLTGHRPGAAVITESQVQSPSQIDYTHPLLERTEGWHLVNVSRSIAVQLQSQDQVLIRLENNQPFLLERTSGAGKLLLVLSGLDNRLNDLPVRPVFVSFIVEVADYLSGAGEIRRSYPAGASLPLSLIGSASGQVIDPDGETVLSLVDTTRAQQIKLDKPGFYEVYTPQGETIVAVNVDPRESRLTRISQELLDRWQAANVQSRDAASGQSTLVETEPVELWHWLLLLLAVVIIAESIVGNAYLAPLGKASR
ncbi:MAG: BatA domain-containing protein [Woeseiaceae bacterium]|nr:BatA domain-containing protein [Woeseiaceae bacterium]